MPPALERYQAELKNEVQVQFQIGRTSFPLSDSFKFSGAIDPGEKTAMSGTWSSGVRFQMVGNGRIIHIGDLISRLQSQRDQQVEDEPAVIQARAQLQTAQRNLTDFRISHFSGPREIAENEEAVIADANEMMEFGDDVEGGAIQLDVEDPKTLLLEAVENAKEIIKEVVKNAKVSVNERRKRQQEENIVKLSEDRAKEFKNSLVKQPMHTSIRNRSESAVAAVTPMAFDDEIEKLQKLKNRLISKKHHIMDILSLHTECFFAPKFLATGKYKCMAYGRQAEHVLWMKHNRGGFVSECSEANSTTTCFLCGCYSPPGLSRIFSCSNQACLLLDFRDPKSSTFIYLTAVTHALMGSKSYSLVNQVLRGTGER
jgi:hypothetical protein